MSSASKVHAPAMSPHTGHLTSAQAVKVENVDYSSAARPHLNTPGVDNKVPSASRGQPTYAPLGPPRRGRVPRLPGHRRVPSRCRTDAGDHRVDLDADIPRTIGEPPALGGTPLDQPLRPSPRHRPARPRCSADSGIKAIRRAIQRRTVMPSGGNPGSAVCQKCSGRALAWSPNAPETGYITPCNSAASAPARRSRAPGISRS